MRKVDMPRTCPAHAPHPARRYTYSNALALKYRNRRDGNSLLRGDLKANTRVGMSA